MSGDDPQLLGPVGVIELWREPSRLWRWRYLEPSADGRPLAFLSNKAYESQQAALHSATTAYPGVAVLQRDTPAGGGRRPNRHRLLLLALVALAVLLLWPRRRRRRPAPGEVAAP
ncbi:MAG TPA: hypothetical protein VF880_05765 [Actinomycetes bacterium]|jgi:hypothetical protein